VATIVNEEEVTLWICVPLRVEVPPPGIKTVTVKPETKLLPLTVTLWFPEFTQGIEGFTEETVGAAA